MWRSIRGLDRILRGDATRPEAVRDGTLDVSILGLSIVVLFLAMLYGACIGSFSLFKELGPAVVDPNDRLMQLLASTVKVPALFFLTLLVTLPSLYVFNALVGSRLNLTALVRLLIAAMGVNLAVLASLGPIVAFFSVSTKSYPFMILFNVAVFAVSGILGMVFLVQTLNRLSLGDLAEHLPEERAADEYTTTDVAAPSHESEPSDEASDVDNSIAPAPIKAALVDQPGALDAVDGHMLGRHVKMVFRCWVIVFSLVGAQMGWVLRPFIGSPDQPFQWLRERDSNFFESVLRTLGQLFGG